MSQTSVITSSSSTSSSISEALSSSSMSQSSVTEKRVLIASSSSSRSEALSSASMSKSSDAEKLTEITSTSSGGKEELSYNANLGNRYNSLSRPSLLSGGMQLVSTMKYTSGFSMVGMDSDDVDAVKDKREQEKKDLRDLNARFGSYIEKVRFLEAQNKNLGSELALLKSEWGKGTEEIKQLYVGQLDEAIRMIDYLKREKAELEVKRNSILEQNDVIQRQLDEAKKYRSQDRETISNLNQQLASYQSEISGLQRSVKSLQTQRSRDKGTINRLKQEVDRLRIDLDNERMAHLDAENRRETLQVELKFMKEVHERELKELSTLAYRDAAAENREFWTSELAQVIRDIETEYDASVDASVEALRGEMEARYHLKINEYRLAATKQDSDVTYIREENTRVVRELSELRGQLVDKDNKYAQLETQFHYELRKYESTETAYVTHTKQLEEQISKLRVEMESRLTELQTLMDAKLSLELEIAAYRTLLEGEESRVGVKQAFEQVTNIQSPVGDLLSNIVSEVKETPEPHIKDQKVEATVLQRKDQKEINVVIKEAQVSEKMTSAKISSQRKTLGPITISEVAADAKYIVLENTSSGPKRQDVNLDGWKLRRTIDSTRDYIYNFDKSFTLKAGKSVKIFARSASSEAGSHDLVFKDEDTWGLGSHMKTSLINDKAEEKAIVVQTMQKN